ncbi:retention module-containing protein [Azoarcus sp. L1K30]|uniref:retention module-containing protein n=1 Tax=Azoarcus sp. L1K30 TaxID=2820277 RepID=UPI001B83F33A|nr:retention module-containing protein [Azoarcus sp. L1K30]MBR0567707.1 retention module-containing protein [Azoarcus sp. L1K30]
MANAQAIATVVSVSGKAYARDHDGNTRELKAGDALLEGETLITSDGGRVELAMVDGSVVPVEEGRSILMTAELADTTRPHAPDAQLADGTIQQVIQALDAGDNLDNVIEDPAAGLAGGGGGDGSSFVRLLRISEDVNPLALDATTADAQTQNALLASAADNIAPETEDTVSSGDEDTPVSVNLLGSDVDGTIAHFIIRSLPTNGHLELNGVVLNIGDEVPASGNAAAVTFVPDANWNGETAFEYTAVDGQGLEDQTPATANIVVNAVNDPPETDDTASAGNEDSPVAVTLSGSDIDGTVDHFVIKSLPSNGSLQLNGVPLHVGDTVPASGNTAALVFVPAANWNGETSFDYAAVDDQGLEDGTPGTVTISVASVNDAPETATTVSSGDEDTAISVSLSGSDVDGFVTHFVIKSLPANGTLLLNGTPVGVGSEVPASGNAATLTFVPNPDWNGSTSFNYASVDNEGLEDATPGTAFINVSDVVDLPPETGGNPAAPETNAVSGSGDADTDISVSLSGSDSDGTVDHFVIKTLPTDGTLQLNGTPLNVGDTVPATGNAATVTFVPNANWNGQTSFDYASVDNDSLEDATPATATITVNAVDAPNVAPETNAGSGSGNEDTDISVSLSGSDSDGTVDHFVIKTLPTDGTLQLNGTPLNVGDTVPATGNAATVTFVPNANWNGQTSFDYAAVDNDALEDATPATATITVNPVDAPNVAPETNAGSGSGDEDTDISVSLSGSDSDGTVDHFVIKTLPTDGTLQLNGTPLNVGDTVPATGNAATVTFVPNANWNGQTSFDYAAVDNDNLEDATPATATITVNPVDEPNVAPETNAGSGSGNEDTDISVSLSGSDSDGTVDHFVIKTLPTDGTLQLNGTPLNVGDTVPATGNAATVTFVPNANWNGQTSFDYAAVDNDSLEDATPATATITVNPLNDPPETEATNANGDEDTSIGVSLSGSDIDGTVDHFVIKTLPTDGTLQLNGTPLNVGDTVPATGNAATVTFVPNANWNGQTSFDYAAVDNDSLEDATPATATITVNPDALVVTHLEPTTEAVPPSVQGLSGAYYGYNDNQSNSIDGIVNGVRVHTNDGTVGNLTSIQKAQQIIAGRAAPDATFTANSLEFGLVENTNDPLFSNDLGRNSAVLAGDAVPSTGSNLYRFLTGSNPGNAGNLVSVSGVAFTTDAIIHLTGQMAVPQGIYDVRITADDGYDVLIGGKSIAEYNGITSTKVTTFTGVDIGGGLQSLDVLYWDQGGHATFRMEFKPTGTDDSAYQPLGEHDYGLFSSSLVVPTGSELVQAGDGSWLIQTGASFSDTDNVPNEVHGTVAADTIHGGGDDDTLYGGLGADTFVWKLNDGGHEGAPAIDTIKDFKLGTFTGSGNADRLDLADLLQNESSSTIDHFLNAEQVGGHTVLHVSSNGGFAGGYAPGAEDQTIVLENVTFDSGLNSHDIVAQLVANHQLLING